MDLMPAPSPAVAITYESLLSFFKEDVRRSPDADFTSAIQELAEKFRKSEREREKRFVDTLFLALYGADEKSLRRDLAKLSVFGKAEVDPSQRVALLRCLYRVLAPYVKDYFPETYAMVEAASGAEKGTPALDTRGSSEPPE